MNKDFHNSSSSTDCSVHHVISSAFLPTVRQSLSNIVYTVQCVTVVKKCCIMGFQGEWKLVALSAPYRLKRPDRRFEELKNYSSELQTHINNIIKIRTVST